ncbi:hypothetical protein H7170_02260 [Candidatus Gracilibacteria bacterium]|nr:hypothetical protein [Candidatus Gracilibacteria bacterium]
MDGTLSDIREKVIIEMANEYKTIFELSPTDTQRVLNNLRVMDDTGLAREILLLQYYHSDTQAIYMRGLTKTLEIASEEEKLNNNPNLILNF